MTLLETASKQRYRIRNLHDGFPVPPFRRLKRSGGFRQKDDACWAVIGKRGYAFEQDGKLEWFYAASQLGVSQADLAMLGAKQVGTGEAAGTCDFEHLDRLLEVIRVYRRPAGDRLAKNLSGQKPPCAQDERNG